MGQIIIDPQVEKSKLESCDLFTNRGFLVTIEDYKGNLIFSSYTISNFSIDGKKIFVTIYDIIQPDTIEGILDDLMKRRCLFGKKRVKITVLRLDNQNAEVYRVVYNGCALKKYHGKNLTYGNKENHLWYLELSFCKKTIIKAKDYDYNVSKILPRKVEPQTKKSSRQTMKKDYQIIKNSNKMLDEAASKVKQNDNIGESAKETSIHLIESAKEENINKFANRYKSFDLKVIEEQLRREIESLGV